MANNLTGDFDVVAEFTTLAIDRLLAAMHQCGRFLHSISARVDDNPHPTHPNWPTTVGVVDAFGNAIANQTQIGSPNPFPGPSAVTNAALSRLSPVINAGELVIHLPPIVPSHIQGVAQLQLFPPTVSVPDNSGSNVSVRMNMMSRFVPDKNTAPLAEFIRGDLQITAPISKIATGRIHVLDIDFKADDAVITFTPSYTSQPLSAEDLAGINLCIQNGLRTSFLPSSVTLPSSIADVQLKTLPGALAVLLDMNDHPSTIGSVTNVFLNSDDDFAFAAGRDYVLNTLRALSDNILSQTFQPIKFTVNAVLTTLHYSYAITLNSVVFDLQSGNIVLTIQGHAGPAQHIPHEFNFTVSVNFSLLPAGNTVELIVGNVSVSTDSTVVDIISYFVGGITNSIKDAVSAALVATDANRMVDTMFNADTNLGNFLNAQLTPSDGIPPTQSQRVFLVYNSVDIQPAGIILHGSLLLFDWPAPYIEFEQIPPNTAGHGPVISPVVQPPDYSALNTWIPGGTISEYDWSMQGQQQAYPFDVDPNRFVLLSSGPPVATAESYTAVPGYSPICLTVKGTRISNYGSPPAYQPVTGTVCGFTKFNVGGLAGILSGKALPTLAVARPGPRGEVVVTGHASAEIDRSGNSAPNLIVHFADAKSLSQLQLLSQAFQQSKRSDAPAAIVVVLTPDQLSKAAFVPGIIYSDDQDAWLGALGLKSSKPPLTAIVAPKGNIVWQEEGTPQSEKLAAALSKHLVKRGPVKVTVPRLNLRNGQPAPNFLFEFAPGHEIPLRKLAGQPVVLVFWKSSVKPSIQAILDLQAAASKAKAPSPLVLAINDGEDPKLASSAAAQNGFTSIVVTDPDRKISVAYGVVLLPTIITLGSSGAVTGIKYGYAPGDHSAPPSNRQPARSNKERQTRSKKND
jgi:peroxiredoxin